MIMSKLNGFAKANELVVKLGENEVVDAEFPVMPVMTIVKNATEEPYKLSLDDKIQRLKIIPS